VEENNMSMAYSIYISGNRISGKTALSLGLFGRFQELGLKVGYFKPIGQENKFIDGKPYDQDILLMKEIMDLDDNLNDICPIVLGRQYLDKIPSNCSSLKEKIKKAFKIIKDGKDIILIEGPPTPEYLTSCKLDSINLAQEFNSKILLAIKGIDDPIAEKTLFFKKYVDMKGWKILGIILNFVPDQQMERMESTISPLFERNKLNVLGIVPDRRELTLPTVEDLADILGAEILTGEESLEKLVDGYLIGAMTPESALSWLRRGKRKAIITGGDRTDLILTALEVRSSVIILTGNLYPSARVINEAKNKGVPLLLVPEDTYTTVSKLEFLDDKMLPSLSSSKKIQLTQKLINDHIKWNQILEDFVAWKTKQKKH
jgi:hypothetical protein